MKTCLIDTKKTITKVAARVHKSTTFEIKGIFFYDKGSSVASIVSREEEQGKWWIE